jgi:type VI secretion system protein ImpC
MGCCGVDPGNTCFEPQATLMEFHEEVVQSIDALKYRNPRAFELACAVSLAVFVDQPLLRTARLRLIPGATAGDEADLWWSQAIESRTTQGFSFQPEAGFLLRTELAQDRDHLDHVYLDLLKPQHQWMSQWVQLEEEIRWRLLRDPQDREVARIQEDILEHIAYSPNRLGIARWLVRAMPYLPAEFTTGERFTQLKTWSHLLLGDASVLEDRVVSQGAGAEFAFVVATLPTTPIAVGFVEDGFRIDRVGDLVGAHEITVPDTRPLRLELQESPESTPRVVTLRKGESHQFNSPSARIILTALDGARHELRRSEIPSSGRFVSRNRPPRVRMEYEMDVGGAVSKIQLPFVTGVMADLSGASADGLPSVDERKFLETDIDTLDSRMKRIKPILSFAVPDTSEGEGDLQINLSFEKMDDFTPAGVAQKVPQLSQLLEVRQQLTHLMNQMLQREGAEDLIAKALANPPLLKTLAAGLSKVTDGRDWERRIERAIEQTKRQIEQIERQTGKEPKSEHQAREMSPHEREASVEGFMELLEREFRPESGSEKLRLEHAVKSLAELTLQQPTTPSGSALETIEKTIAIIDAKLSDQMNVILHHPDFQNLESAWRGLHYLVSHTETDEMVKIRVLNISKAELARTLRSSKGINRRQNAIFKNIYEEYELFGGQPYGCLIGDYFFDHSPDDVEALAAIAGIAAEAQCPFIAAAAPALFQLESWQELGNSIDVSRVLSTPEYARWRSLRESQDARYIGLTMPRFLGRVPYGDKNPVEEFDLREEVQAADGSRYTWVNSAYAMAVNINRAFKLYGWVSRIRGVETGGVVENLPVHTFPTDDGGVDAKRPTEIAITDRREMELSKSGFMPLMHRKNTDSAAFISASSLQQPPQFDDPNLTANANLAARLPYLFPCCRVAQYLLCMYRDKIGGFKEARDLEHWLKNWMYQYVDGDPSSSSEALKASKPLAAARIEVEAGAGDPGYYTARLYLQPHYQLEGLTSPLRIAIKFPSVKGA